MADDEIALAEAMQELRSELDRAIRSSTPTGTTNQQLRNERCPETPVNGVLGHHIGVRGGT